MKRSLTVTLLILALGAMFAWWNHGRFAAIREEHRRLSVEGGPGKPGRSGTRVREDRAMKDQEARDLSRELIALILESKKAEKAGAAQDPEIEKRGLAAVRRLVELDAAQIRVVIAELRSMPDLDPKIRKEIIAISVRMIASDHPETALALFSEDPDVGKEVVETALENLGKRNPAAALDWIRRRAKENPELMNEGMKRGVIAGISGQDPKLAFQLIRELGLANPETVCASIVSSAKTPEQRRTLLETFRSEAGSFETEQTRQRVAGTLFGGLARQLSGETFESAQTWLSSASLKPEELTVLTSSLSASETKGDTGRWVEWMGRSLSGADLDTRVDRLVSEWTNQDYKAAGEWLNTTPDGPARLAAIASYTRTVAPYEPQTAAQWAQTLPAGDPRNEAARAVYQAWKKTDAGAAAAFARQQGIEE